MERDDDFLPPGIDLYDRYRWLDNRPTSYFGPNTPDVVEGNDQHYGYLKVPRVYSCGTCIVAINLGYDPLPSNEHDIASKFVMHMAIVNTINRCVAPGGPGGGPLRGGGLIVLGAFVSPSLHHCFSAPSELCWKPTHSPDHAIPNVGIGERQKLWLTAFHVPNLPYALAKRRARGYVNDPGVIEYLNTCRRPGGGGLPTKRSIDDNDDISEPGFITCPLPSDTTDLDLNDAVPAGYDDNLSAELEADIKALDAEMDPEYCVGAGSCGWGYDCVPYQMLQSTTAQTLFGVGTQQNGWWADEGGLGVCVDNQV
ncbi:MAG: hypothetical protein M1827_004567 [Pycnora praestabilis]|nr:MAG: hypothetical protein M1827_004567 [Pycnora praestabilis]